MLNVGPNQMLNEACGTSFDDEDDGEVDKLPFPAYYTALASLSPPCQTFAFRGQRFSPYGEDKMDVASKRKHCALRIISTNGNCDAFFLS